MRKEAGRRPRKRLGRAALCACTSTRTHDTRDQAHSRSMLHLFASLLLGTTTSNVTLFFGNGCFWARQHTFITQLEQAALGRTDAQLTSVAAYAGGIIPKSGALCYENVNRTDQYADYGAAEVVSMVLKPTEVGRAASVYFSTFVELQPGVWGRADPQDIGAEYRALVGVPGGLDGPHGPALRAANVHNMTLIVDKEGRRPDTIGTNRVYVMDSDVFPAVQVCPRSFPFPAAFGALLWACSPFPCPFLTSCLRGRLQAEICLQCHNDALVKYPLEYHQLNRSLIRNGRLRPTSCPRNYVC